MGGGSFSTAAYVDRSSTLRAAGKTAFVYTDDMKHKPSSTWKTHDSLDPKGVTREARDSTEHPASLPVAVLFDVTGSMSTVPRVCQSKLGTLMAFLVGKLGLDDAQIMFGGIGDATCDRAPLQIGQFESSNAMDHDLGNVLLEGGGGGQVMESYELGMYFMARHTSCDAFEKRGKKGYLFLIGDEKAYDKVNKSQVEDIIGDTLEAHIALADIVAELAEKWEVFFLIPQHTSHGQDPQIAAFWKELFNERAILLPDENVVAEVIGGIIGLCEGIDLNDVTDSLKAAGADSAAIGAATSALATMAASTGGAGTAVATTDTALPDGASGAQRL